MNTKGYISGPVFCQAPTQSVSDQDARYGVRQDTHSGGIGAFDGLAFSGPNLNCNSETSFEKPQQNQSELLTLSMEHNIILYYVNYKSSEVPGQKFLFSLHSNLCCSSCTCVCQLAWHLTRHFDSCHSSDCLLCGPVWNLINSYSTKLEWETGVNLKERPIRISLSPEKLIAGHKDEKVYQNDVIFIGDDDAEMDGREWETGVNLKEGPISISPEKIIAGHKDEKVYQNDVIFIGDDNADMDGPGWETGVNLKEGSISISPEKLIAGHKDEKVYQNEVIFIGDDDADLDGSPGPKEELAPNHVSSPNHAIVIDYDLISQWYQNHLDGFPDLEKEMGPNKVVAINDDSDDLVISENYPNQINCDKKLQHLALYQEAKMRSCADSSMTEHSELQHDGLFERPNKIDYETLQKKEVEVFRLQREASLMKKIIMGYREALKETNRVFAEYRARCPLPDEPLYNDVPGTGGLVLSTMELQKHIAVI